MSSILSPSSSSTAIRALEILTYIYVLFDPSNHSDYIPSNGIGTGTEVSTFAEKCHTVHLLRGNLFWRSPSQAITYDNVMMEGMSVETVARI
jgi:hypothetical protein